MATPLSAPRPLRQPCGSPGSKPRVQKHLRQAREHWTAVRTSRWSHRSRCGAGGGGRASPAPGRESPPPQARGQAVLGKRGRVWTLASRRVLGSIGTLAPAPRPQCVSSGRASRPDPRNAHHVRGTVENLPESTLSFEKTLSFFPVHGVG